MPFDPEIVSAQYSAVTLECFVILAISPFSVSETKGIRQNCCRVCLQLTVYLQILGLIRRKPVGSVLRQQTS